MTRKMKDSGIEWIGDIPEDWGVVPLKFVVGEFYSGGTPSSSTDSFYTDKENGEPFINISDLTNNKEVNVVQKHITKLAAQSKNLKLINNDYILFAMYASTGTVSRLSVKSYISQAILAIKPNKEANKEFLYYFLYSFKPFSTAYSRGTTQNNLNADIVKNIKISLPSLKTQQYIIRVLNIKLDKIDKIKNLITQEIQTLEAYKKSIITEAITKGLDKNVEMKDSGIEWIGEIPKHWEVIKLKNLVSIIAKGISPNYVEEKITPVVNQATFSKGYFDYNLKYCRDSIHNEALLKKNDVLIATTGGGVLGKTYYFEEDENYLASTDVAFIRTNKPEISKLIYYFLSTKYDLLNGIFAKGSTNQTHLQMEMLSNMHIAIPHEHELKKIIRYLDEHNGIIDDSIKQKKHQLEILEDYKKSLIYEYVTGKKEVPHG